MQLKKILVAVKPWERGVPLAATHARELSKHVDAEIELVGTVFDSAVAAGQERGDAAAWTTRRRAVDQALVELERLAGPMRDSNIRLTTRVVWGVPAYEGIVRSAEESSADLLVVSAYEPETSHCRLTETDWQLMRRVSCPLLLVKTPVFAGYRTILAIADSRRVNNGPQHADHAVLDAGRCLADVCGSTLVEGESADVVVDLAMRWRAELVIIAAPRYGPGLTADGTAENVAAQAPCDVLIVPAAPAVDESLELVRSQIR